MRTDLARNRQTSQKLLRKSVAEKELFCRWRWWWWLSTCLCVYLSIYLSLSVCPVCLCDCVTAYIKTNDRTWKPLFCEARRLERHRLAVGLAECGYLGPPRGMACRTCSSPRKPLCSLLRLWVSQAHRDACFTGTAWASFSSAVSVCNMSEVASESDHQKLLNSTVSYTGTKDISSVLLHSRGVTYPQKRFGPKYNYFVVHLATL